jgi:anti-anti-sigma regulatory factor
MLMIMKETENSQLTRITLHGRFTAEYVREIERALPDNAGQRGNVALDLRSVTFVDRAAMEFLCRAKSKKIRIENTPPYVLRWIEQESQHTLLTTH